MLPSRSYSDSERGRCAAPDPAQFKPGSTFPGGLERLLDSDEALAQRERALAAASPAARHAGQEAFVRAIRDASSPFRREDGSNRFDNIIRLAVARVR